MDVLISRAHAAAIVPGVTPTTHSIAFSLLPKTRPAGVSPILLFWSSNDNIITVEATAPEHIGLYAPEPRALSSLVLHVRDTATTDGALVVDANVCGRLDQVRFVPRTDADFVAMARAAMAAANGVLVANWDFTSVCRADVLTYIELMDALVASAERVCVMVEVPSHVHFNSAFESHAEYATTYGRYLSTLQRLRSLEDRVLVSLCGIPHRFSLYGHKTLFLAERIKGVLLCQVRATLDKPYDYSLVREWVLKLSARRFLALSELDEVLATATPLMPEVANVHEARQTLAQYQSFRGIDVDPKTRAVTIKMDKWDPAYPTDFPQVFRRYFGFVLEYDTSYVDDRVNSALAQE